MPAFRNYGASAFNMSAKWIFDITALASSMTLSWPSANGDGAAAAKLGDQPRANKRRCRYVSGCLRNSQWLKFFSLTVARLADIGCIFRISLQALFKWNSILGVATRHCGSFVFVRNPVVMASYRWQILEVVRVNMGRIRKYSIQRCISVIPDNMVVKQKYVLHCCRRDYRQKIQPW